MGTTTRYRFREYVIRSKADPLTLPTLTAVCVTGDDQDCGATSGDVHSADELVKWIARHCAETRHELYERTVRETVCAQSMAVRPIELWQRFTWTPGECFKCERDGVPVTVLGTLAGVDRSAELSAYEACTFRLELRLHGELSSPQTRRPLRLPPPAGAGRTTPFGAPLDGFRTSQGRV